MRKRMLSMIVLSTCFLIPVAFADERASNFAAKGVLEFGGSFSTSGIFYNDENNEYLRSRFSIQFDPILNYYFIDKIHIGLVPYLNYTYYDVRSNYTTNPDYAKHQFFFGPSFSFGYTIRLAENLFLDASPSLEYEHYFVIFHSSSSNKDYDALYYFLRLSLKYLIGNTLIGINLAPGYHEYIGVKPLQSSNYFEINFGIAISFFVPIN